MKETVMLVVRSLVAQGKAAEAMEFIKTPTDILRYLWYVKTGKTQIVEPCTLIDLARRNSRHISYCQDRSIEAAEKRREELRLKYDRGMCRTVAHWMNVLSMSAKQAAEIMNPKRGMWVRMIRALRLGEYVRREGMERLKELLALKAEAQGLALATTAAAADEAYTYEWALNPADVAGILL